jgi:LPS-assembly lipoprotein
MKIRLLASLVLCIAITGCGWQLRGSSNLATNIDALNITSGQHYGALSRSLEEQMRLQHIAASGLHAWNLVILDQEMKVNILAYSDTNNAATNEIELTVQFTVTDEKGVTVIAPNTERVVRLYESNNDRRLAMDRETQLLKNEAYEEMAANLLRRIDFIAGQKKEAAP